jgi:hypothetical protein
MVMNQAVKRLRPGRTMRLKLASSARILIARGKVWLTAQGDATDYLLQAGAEFPVRPHAEIVLEALGRTAVIATRGG